MLIRRLKMQLFRSMIENIPIEIITFFHQKPAVLLDAVNN